MRCASSRPVDGISCIRPRAPERLTAAGSKALSWRIMANSSGGGILCVPAKRRTIGSKAVG